MFFFTFKFCIFYLCIVSAISYPSKKVLFPSEDDDDTDDDQFSNYDSLGINSEESESEQNTSKIKFRIDAANVPCTNSTIPFCEDVNQRLYPSQYVETVLQKSPDLYTKFFNKLETRNDFTAPIDLCETYQRSIHPQLAMNVQNDWRFVINQPNYRQPIRVELCQKRTSKCQFSDSFPSGFVSSCTQKFTEIPLLSLDDDGEIQEFNYKFPSHCQCEMRKVKRRIDERRPSYHRDRDLTTV